MHRASIDLERGDREEKAQQGRARQLNKFMDALLGPIAEDMLTTRAPQVVCVCKYGWMNGWMDGWMRVCMYAYVYV
jgi:hypothetical protein